MEAVTLRTDSADDSTIRAPDYTTWSWSELSKLWYGDDMTLGVRLPSLLPIPIRAF